jgi:beta-lysine 5,6-aminomutase alpha subunit
MKLVISSEQVQHCRAMALAIAREVQIEIASMSTVSVERSLLRLVGMEGATAGVPWVNTFLEQMEEQNALEDGALYWLGNALCATGLSIAGIGQEVGEGRLDVVKTARHPRKDIQEIVATATLESLRRLFLLRTQRRQFQNSLPVHVSPLLYVIVASGNIYDDIAQAKAAAEQGADVIAVIRSAAQSLLDFVPEGVTTEGFGGTYATQANYRLMRSALDEVSRKTGRYIHQINYCSGLCMAEIAALAILEGLDLMVNDALYGILFRDLNMVRTMIDQHFSRYLLGLFDLTIVTGEDNLIKTVDAFQQYYIVLTSQFINEQLAKQAGMQEKQIGLGHAAELDPSLPDSFLWELVQAQLVRQIFPRSPVKFMPPTRYISGNIFFAHVLDTLFNLTAVWTGQEIILLGMPTEGIHTPYVQDRYLSLESAMHLRSAASSLRKELNFRRSGKSNARAQEILNQTESALSEIEQIGLWTALNRGMFSQIKRSRKGGRGVEGVFPTSQFYLNPFLDQALVKRARNTVR